KVPADQQDPAAFRALGPWTVMLHNEKGLPKAIDEAAYVRRPVVETVQKFLLRMSNSPVLANLMVANVPVRMLMPPGFVVNTHFLFLPDVMDGKRQLMAERDIRAALTFLASNRDGRWRMFHNSIGAGGMLNNLHIHAFELPKEITGLAFDTAKTALLRERDYVKVSRLDGYPAKAFVFEGDEPARVAAQAGAFLKNLQIMGQPYNVVMSRNRVVVFPRGPELVTIRDKKYYFGAVEMSGLIDAPNADMQQSLTEDEIKGLLTEATIDDVKFAELTRMVTDPAMINIPTSFALAANVPNSAMSIGDVAIYAVVGVLSLSAVSIAWFWIKASLLAKEYPEVYNRLQKEVPQGLDYYRKVAIADLLPRAVNLLRAGKEFEVKYTPRVTAIRPVHLFYNDGRPSDVQDRSVVIRRDKVEVVAVENAMINIPTFLSLVANRADNQAMVSEVMQWLQANPGLVIAGVVAKGAAVLMARAWWLKNTVAGRLRLQKIEAEKLREQKELYLFRIKALEQKAEEGRLAGEAETSAGVDNDMEIEYGLTPEEQERNEMMAKSDTASSGGQPYIQSHPIGWTTKKGSNNSAMTGSMDGGIDIQNINVAHKKGSAKIQFNDDALRAVLKNGFSGFTPLIMNISTMESPLAALGIN
ncbi:MAG: hypothetical protein HQL19_02340, partial [Candidatus Omnitrophica bacterium]|nr:hypothetical protein [Candidatus Omnitrophota bacterium]